MSPGGDVLKVPTELQIRDRLQSHGMSRLSEEMDEALYREYFESISVTREVMAVLVGMPEIASVEEAKEYVRATTGTRREASTGPRRHGGLRSAATRFWRHVVAFLSPDSFGRTHGRYPGVN